MTTREWTARLELFEAFDVEEEVEATLSEKREGEKGSPRLSLRELWQYPDSKKIYLHSPGCFLSQHLRRD